MKMLILPGISGHFAGQDWPRGALDEPSAREYAALRGYDPQVLYVKADPVEADSPQVRSTLATFRSDLSITALYGFSGGGYNVKHVIDDLIVVEKERIQLLVVLGAPNNAAHDYVGKWELVYRLDPPGGHMDGPRALLQELIDSRKVTA